jgi:hypothetical protein
MLTLRTECLFVYELQFDDEQVQRDLAEIAGGNSIQAPAKSSSASAAAPQEDIVKLQ